jgi:hypothetical protein
VDGVRPKVRFLRGVSEANCKTVETRCGGRGSGVPGREGLRRRSMKPYLSTSPPLTSSQSSIPPASSCELFIPSSSLGFGGEISEFLGTFGLKNPFALIFVSNRSAPFDKVAYISSSSASLMVVLLSIAGLLLIFQPKVELVSYIDLTFCDSNSRSFDNGFEDGETSKEKLGCLGLY